MRSGWRIAFSDDCGTGCETYCAHDIVTGTEPTVTKCYKGLI